MYILKSRVLKYSSFWIIWVELLIKHESYYILILLIWIYTLYIVVDFFIILIHGIVILFFE